MKLTIEMDIPEEAVGAVQVHFARLAALHSLKSLRSNGRRFERTALRTTTGVRFCI